jgi:hypothetical protein
MVVTNDSMNVEGFLMASSVISSACPAGSKETYKESVRLVDSGQDSTQLPPKCRSDDLYYLRSPTRPVP